MNQSPRPKHTGRRRHGRNGTPQKTYASENDAAGYRHHLSDSPFTPQKVDSKVNGAAQPAQTTNQKPRATRTSSAKKPRNKQERQSPVEQPALPSAYAGTSFHASPAPGSLPLPSFLARTTSAPDSPSLKPPPGPSQELSPPTTDSEGNNSPSPPLALRIEERNEESPLDFFFKADRAEKARARRASSANAGGYLAGPFSPPHDSPQECGTFPRTQVAPSTRRPVVQRNPSSGIPSSELDGTPGRPLGQAFSTPYSERIKAARSKNSTQVTPSAPSNDNTDRSEALKRFLGVSSPSQTQVQSSLQPHQPQQEPHFQGTSQAGQPKLPRGVFPASVLAGAPLPSQLGQPQPIQASTRSTGMPQEHHQASVPLDSEADQVRRMEDSLRRVLKLGPAA